MSLTRRSFAAGLAAGTTVVLGTAISAVGGAAIPALDGESLEILRFDDGEQFASIFFEGGRFVGRGDMPDAVIERLIAPSANADWIPPLSKEAFPVMLEAEFTGEKRAWIATKLLADGSLERVGNSEADENAWRILFAASRPWAAAPVGVSSDWTPADGVWADYIEARRGDGGMLYGGLESGLA